MSEVVRNHWALVAVGAVMLASICVTATVALAEEGDDGSSAGADAADRVLFLNNLPELNSVQPVEEISCTEDVGSMSGTGPFQTVQDCRDELRKSADSVGADLIVLTTQDIECGSGSCRIFMFGTAFTRGGG